MRVDPWRHSRSVVAVLLVVTSIPLRPCAGFAAPLTDPAPVSPDEPWPSYNDGLDGQRFSPLTQINRNTLPDLAEICRVPLGDPGPFEAGLVVVGETMYLTTTHDTIALDPRTCLVRWRHTYVPEDQEVYPPNRGVAVLAGRVYRGTADGRLLALDAATGALVWKTVLGNPHLGEFVSSAPIAWDGLVFAGIAGSDWGVRGRMMAFDAVTGREVWRFNTIPVANETGADTWSAGSLAWTGGGGLWTSYTFDSAAGEVLIPVGNPAPDFAPAYRPGSNLFTNSIVALDARTGALKWWYQATPHDGLDYDLSAAPLLYADREGRSRVAFAGKDGYLQAIDRDTRRLLFRTPVTTIRNEGAIPTEAGTTVCPGDLGGAEWNGPSFDQANDALVVGTVDWCGTARPPRFQLLNRLKHIPLPGFGVALVQDVFAMLPSRLRYQINKYLNGGSFSGGTMERTGTPTGWVTSVDAETGATRWRYHADAPVLAGVTSTAGGLVFTGDNAGNLLVFDGGSGALVRKMATGGALAGGMITYRLAGQQYLAFASGNISRSTFGALGVPTVVVMGVESGDIAGGPRDPAGGTQFANTDDAKQPAPDSTGRQARGSLLDETATKPPSGSIGVPEQGDVDHGRRIYAGICVSCHGADGAAVSGHSLQHLATRMNMEQANAWIRNPQPPMPRFFPSVLSSQDVRDVASFIEGGSFLTADEK